MKKHLPHSPPDAESLGARLRSQARKLTGPRRAIVELLAQQDHPVTIREISQLLETQCDTATIYRSIHLLTELGLMQRFDFGDGIARYELLHAGHESHHHHLICTSCARVVEIEDCFPRELEERIAGRNGFTEISHRLEFFGRCPACTPK